jgi:hypothetical protein
MWVAIGSRATTAFPLQFDGSSIVLRIEVGFPIKSGELGPPVLSTRTFHEWALLFGDDLEYLVHPRS